MFNNRAIQSHILKMATTMRNVFFLSLAVNIFEIYGFIREPGQGREIISIGLGIAGTVFIWLMSRALGQGKRESLYYWLAAGLAGYIRWGVVDTGFEFNIFSIGLIGVLVAFTVRLFIWSRNGSLA